MMNMNEYVQELLANTVEAMVEMYELKDGTMSVEMAEDLAQIGRELAELLKDFVESNQ